MPKHLWQRHLSEIDNGRAPPNRAGFVTVLPAKPILIISSRADIAGGENYLLSCFRHLDQHRFHPVVWLPGDGAFRAALEKAGIEYLIEPIHYGRLARTKRWYQFLSGLPERVHRIAEFIHQRDIQIVHTNSNMILEGALAAKLTGTHHLFLAHIDFQPNLPVYRRFPLERSSFAQIMGDLSSAILAVSEHVRDTLCPPLPRDRVTVVNNGLEMSRYDAALASKKEDFRESLGLEENAVIAIAAGRVTEDKGFDLLVEAAGMLCNDHPDVMFLLCGPVDSQTYQSALNKRIVELGLDERVFLLGRRTDLPELMAQSDVFVLPSRREGHPYVLLEAMACELPAVATRCGGVDETVVEGESGFIVPIEDAGAIATSLAALLTDRDLRTRMGEAAGRRVRQCFTERKTAEGLFSMYEKLLEMQQPTAGSYGVDLLLQAATEYGYLGERITAIEERIKKTERAAELVLDNRLMRLARRLLKQRGRNDG